MRLSQKHYDELKKRRDDGVADDDDRRLLKIYEQAGDFADGQPTTAGDVNPHDDDKQRPADTGRKPGQQGNDDVVRPVVPNVTPAAKEKDGESSAQTSSPSLRPPLGE